MGYEIDVKSKQILDEIRVQAGEAARVRTSHVPDLYPSQQQQSSVDFVGIATITAAGSDSSHWQWKFSVRDHSTGDLNAADYGYVQMGECVTPSGLAVSVGDAGLLFFVLNDDSSTSLLFIAISNTLGDGGFWAIITGTPALVTGNAARWSYGFAEATGQWTTTGKAQVMPGGRTGTMYNAVESGNPTSGIGTMAGGVVVSSDDFSNGIKLQPIAPGDCVWVRLDNTCNTTGSGSGTGSGTGPTPPIYIFQGWNVKGECPP